MKKNFVRVMLFGALTLTVSTVVTSCKDYDDDIKGLQEQVDKITSTGDQLEEVMGKRTRAIERKLRQVEQLPHEESMKILPIDDGDDESTD